MGPGSCLASVLGPAGGPLWRELLLPTWPKRAPADTLTPVADKKPTTYWDYIKLEQLTALQSGLADSDEEISNDEVLFITVHQIFELWFKLILRELRAARDLFRSPHVAEQELSGAVRKLKRATTILRRCVSHFEVIETLTTRDYLSFRDKLFPASGFQSRQLRQIEIVLGLRDEERIPFGSEGGYVAALKEHDGSASVSMRKVQETVAEGESLCEAIDEWLYRTPIDGVGPDASNATEALDAFLERFLENYNSESDIARDIAISHARNQDEVRRIDELYADERASVEAFFTPSEEKGGARRRRIRAAALFVETYRELPLLAWPREVLDSLVEMEQQLTVFRQRHARMVERAIGRRAGTGGTAGVAYLDKTALKYRVFKDLWAIRTLQIRREAASDLDNPDFYSFLQPE